MNSNWLEKIKKIDPGNILGSVEALPNQCLDAWEEASKVKVPQEYQNVDHLVMTGMGGSGLGARVIESVFRDKLRIPLVRVNDYNLPGFVNEKTLVVCSSYSGNTEEVIENAKQASARGTKWIAIGSGGKLLEMAKNHGIPFYKISPKHNPSNQPRMAVGYSVIGQLVLVSKTGLFKLEKKDILVLIEAMKNIQSKNSAQTPNNPAQKLAKKMYGRTIFFVAARHLVGASHTVNNQFNENAKVFSADFTIPELNHHLMEGLKHPSSNIRNLFFLFIKSDLYPERIKKRLEITEDVVAKNKIELASFKPGSKTKLAQAFELIQFGAYTNLYLSVLQGQNPAPIPWVDYFKEKLAS